MKHLIHIGLPKAASTFLQEWFYQHPQICYQHGALAGFRNVYEVCHQAVQAEEPNFKYFVTSYEGLVTPRPSSGRNPIENGMEDARELAKPFYESQKKACRILKDLYPDSKILLVTRGFKSFLLSGYSQYARTGGTYSFENLVQILRQTDALDQDYIVDYDYICKLYSDAFGEENLIVLPYEMLRDNKRKFLSAIEERLGLDHFEENIGRINESLSAEELYWYPRISHRISRLAQKLGPSGYARFYNWYIEQTINRRLRKLARALSYWRKITEVDGSNLSPELMQRFGAKANVFLNDPLYSSYRSEYFLED